MKEEFTITRQGKQYVLFAGLLDEFHRIANTDQYKEGTATTDTDLLQVPAADNGNVAIVKATVGIKDGDKWLYGPFTGIGDASPENVGRNIIPHIIRMAETRAKARAMRDAINVTAALQDDESTHEEDAPRQQELPRRDSTREQHDEINKLGAEVYGRGKPWQAQRDHILRNRNLRTLSQLSFEQAEVWINTLEERSQEQSA